MKHNWEYKQWNEVLKIFNGKNQKAVENPNGPYPIYGSGGIMSYADDYICPENCTIIGRKGNINNPIFVPTKFWNVDTAFGLCPNDLLQPRYLYYFCQIYDFEKHNKATTIPSLVKNDLLKICIPVPPMATQEQIVAELDQINDLIAKSRELLSQLDALAQSLFYDTFGDPISNPKGFTIVPLYNVFSLITDGTHQTPTYTTDTENGVKFLSAKDVVNGYIDWTNIKYIPFDLHVELHKRLAPQRGDILLCKNGTTGICALVETDDIFDIYVSLALLRPKTNTCRKYLVYAINNPFTREQFNHSLKGIGVPNLHLNKIRATKIILPPLALQEDFAAKVEAIEAQKAKVEAEIAELQTLLDARMDYWFN